MDDIRRDFPLITQGKVVYLDNAATTQKPRAVIDALVEYYENYNANVHRGVYEISEKATDAYEAARKKIADFIGAKETASIIFTRNATEAVNLAAYAWGDANVNEGDEILLTEMEHHSNIVPWQLLAQRKKAVIRFVPYAPETGKPKWEDLPSLSSSKTRLIAFTHVSNSLGTINPVPELIAQIRRLAPGAKILIDGAQGVPHLPVNVAAWDCDFLVFSAHKMLGPTGIGVFYAKKDVLEGMGPFLGGGDMIKEVRLDGAKWNDLPWKFEAGTPNIADAIAFGAALDYLNAIGLKAIHEHEVALTTHALQRLRAIEGVTCYGTKTAPERCGVVSFNLKGMHPHDTGTLLAREGVAVRVGHHCNMPLMRRLGIMGTTRASFYLYNTIEEIDALAAAIPKIQKVFM
ncbi:MAG: cysteine desulfurase [Elusimicrobia bacterium]|nr:cysteine desulfurase [Elusimicrobiota bacterium]